ncbi:MAG TPA: triphosphoribosyl-dephospho-CoA synthase, partial [Chroococcales cyanobacterium]
MNKERRADRILEILTAAMLNEISLTPKPGLIDRGAFSAHRDMDFFSFVRSSAAIAPHFRRIFLLPFAEKDCFAKAREIGIEAEKRMLEATGGVNTQKGIIFLGGLLALSCGSLLARGEEFSKRALREEMADFGKGLTGELRRNEAGSH